MRQRLIEFRISIHALLAESDKAQTLKVAPLSISIHALLAESDNNPIRECQIVPIFLSTLSLRRATGTLSDTSDVTAISIHALLAESDELNSSWISSIRISIHALLAESDVSAELRVFPVDHFYPRSPCGERPNLSICACWTVHFYPRSPCGERPWARGSRVTYIEFLSTLSLRRATPTCTIRRTPLIISIHALLAESDRVASFHYAPGFYFYPRSPCGERHA